MSIIRPVIKHSINSPKKFYSFEIWIQSVMLSAGTKYLLKKVLCLVI